MLKTELGTYQEAVNIALAQIEENEVISRIWNHNYTVWSIYPTEIINRLGWLTIADRLAAEIDKLKSFASEIKSAGITHVLLLGMGGSSLAPEVFSITFPSADRLSLEILDTTDPGAVLAFDRKLDLTKTLFIVATKSGGTAETLSGFKYFYNRLKDMVGEETVGKHFVAITDPGSSLVKLAEQYQFRRIFQNDPNIGGRYSALSYFGLVPAVLVGVDLQHLLGSAIAMGAHTRLPAEQNDGAKLGAILGELAKVGRDKLTLVLSPAIAHFGDWIEQLVAESTGKMGMGILPVVWETLAKPDSYSQDRVFVYLKLEGDNTYDEPLAELQKTGQPIVTIPIKDTYALGGQFMLWEFATVVASYRLGIQPFDQPNVEQAKNLARAMIEQYQNTGKLPEVTVNVSYDGIDVIGDLTGERLEDALDTFINLAGDGSYFCVQAYLQPTTEATALLRKLQDKLRNRSKRAVVQAYGPRFLHSTGQLHKGDSGKGLFIQITADVAEDVPIPNEAGKDESAMSFGTLLASQALGDRAALLEAKRTVVRFHLKNAISGLRRLVGAI